MVLAVKALPPALEAGPDAGALLLPGAAGVLLVLLPELAHADTVRARAARPAAPHIFRIRISPLHSANYLPLEITCGRAIQFTLSSCAPAGHASWCWAAAGRSGCG